jgi:hypothetical protein
MKRAHAALAAMVPALLAACGGVSFRVRDELRTPESIAVLPFAGSAPPEAREAARALLQSRLQARGFHTVELRFVDRVLSERGWLRDPADFDPAALAMPDVATALGVDAVAVATDVEERAFHTLLLRRHAFGGSMSLHRRDGVWWSAQYSASTLGGLALGSGQVFAELQAQGTHGTPMATLALVDQFVTDAAATVPARKAAARPDAEPRISNVTMSPAPGTIGHKRFVVEASVSPGADVRFDLVPGAGGVPMVALPGQSDRFAGSYELPAEATVTTVVVQARSPFGRTARVEVKP